MCQSYGDVRLVDSNLADWRVAGRVEIYMNSEWKRIYASITEGVSKTVCWQLGYSDHIRIGSASDFG